MTYLLRSLIVYLDCKGKSYLKFHTQNNKYLKKFKTSNGATLGLGSISELCIGQDTDTDWGHIKSTNRKRQLIAGQELSNRLTGTNFLIKRNELGRPYFDAGDLNISISHTKQRISAIVGTVPVAIDIESHERSTDLIQAKFTTRLEMNHVASVFSKNPGILIWSCKECLFKVMKTEAVHFKENLTIESIKEEDGKYLSLWNVNHPELSAQFFIESLIFEDLIVSYIDSLPT